ncbi:MAG: fatty acid CoA ligase family protein [Elusimicrobiota bacterium]
MTTQAPARDVAARFLEAAARLGDTPAVIAASGNATFAQLASDVARLAAGLRRAGIAPGDRVALLVPPSRDLYACTFALFRMGAVPVFIDPGIGFKNMGRCLAETQPAAFVGSPKAHLARLLGGWAPSAKISIVADGKIPGLWSSREIRGMGARAALETAAPAPEDAAAVLFTSGSTGAPKGAVYTHAMFSAQVELLRSVFGIQEGEVSVPTFPLFGLFDVALGMTCVIPDMDFTRPGGVDPARLIDTLQRRRADQLFGSPALLERVGRYGEKHGIALPNLKRVLSAGAPVNAKILERFAGMLSTTVEIFTPYGATEALPISIVGSREILNETSLLTKSGRGICVGLPVSGINVEIIKISDAPIDSWSDSLKARPGEIGEIVVSGPVVSKAYYHRPAETSAAKIRDGENIRHRMGDLGYLDDRNRLWFCGRKSHRVRTAEGDLYTIPVEGVFNAHPDVKRCALVGVGSRPVLCVEREPDARRPEAGLTRELLALGSGFAPAAAVRTILYHPSFPVDIRHNAKIFREKLAVWAAARLGA